MKIYGVFLKSSVLCKNALDIGGKDTKTTGTLGKSTNKLTLQWVSNSNSNNCTFLEANFINSLLDMVIDFLLMFINW